MAIVQVHPVPPDDPAVSARAGAIASRLGAPLGDGKSPGAGVVLRVGADRLELHAPGVVAGSGPVFVDFAIDAVTLSGGNRRQPLARAVGVGAGRGEVVVLDCTAGLLGDSLLLGALGCRVLCIERDAALHEMHADAIERLRAHADDRLRRLADRLTPLRAEAREVLCGRAGLPAGFPRPTAALIDPMHPERTKSALVKKEMRVVRALVGEDPDSGELLLAALRSPLLRPEPGDASPPARIVVKLPLRAAPLGLPGGASAAPVHTHKARSVRYDVFHPLPEP